MLVHLILVAGPQVHSVGTDLFRLQAAPRDSFPTHCKVKKRQ